MPNSIPVFVFQIPVVATSLHLLDYKHNYYYYFFYNFNRDLLWNMNRKKKHLDPRTPMLLYTSPSIELKSFICFDERVVRPHCSLTMALAFHFFGLTRIWNFCHLVVFVKLVIPCLCWYKEKHGHVSQLLGCVRVGGWDYVLFGNREWKDWFALLYVGGAIIVCKN